MLNNLVKANNFRPYMLHSILDKINRRQNTCFNFNTTQGTYS